MVSIYSQAWESALCTLADEARHPAVPRTPVPVIDRQLLERAYLRCESVISEHGKTFNLASSLLPPAKRRAIRALYAFCRVTDNIVDCSNGSPEEEWALLAAWRYRAVTASPPRDDLVATAWADTRLRYNVPHKYSEQLIEGVARDELAHHKHRAGAVRRGCHTVRHQAWCGTASHQHLARCRAGLAGGPGISAGG